MSDVSYVILAKDGLRPWEDDAYRFDEAGGSIYGPNVDAGAATFEKWLNNGRLLTESTTAARYAELDYDTDTSGTYTELVTAVDGGLTEENVSGEITYTRIRYKIVLATGDENHTPRVIAAIFGNTPNPPRYRMWNLVLDVADHQRQTTGGETRPLPYDRALSHLFASVMRRVTYTDYFGESYTAKVLNVSAQGITPKATSTARTNAQSLVQVVVVEISENETIGLPGIWGSSAWASGVEWSP